MRWTGFGSIAAGGEPKVTGYGTTNRRCQIQGWALDSVSVRCFDSAGNPVDNGLRVKPVAVPEPGHVALLASGTALLAVLSRRVRHHTNGTKSA